MSESSGRDAKRVLGAGVFLLAFPAWASDMCPLAMVLLLPPVFVLALVSFVAGLLVRGHTAARVWKVLLGVLALPALGALLMNFGGAYHEEELMHGEMIGASIIALLTVLFSYLWTFSRLERARESVAP
jgi:preprotein translocase subunit SecY